MMSPLRTLRGHLCAPSLRSAPAASIMSLLGSHIGGRIALPAARLLTFEPQ